MNVNNIYELFLLINQVLKPKCYFTFLLQFPYVNHLIIIFKMIIANLVKINIEYHLYFVYIRIHSIIDQFNGPKQPRN